MQSFIWKGHYKLDVNLMKVYVPLPFIILDHLL